MQSPLFQERLDNSIVLRFVDQSVSSSVKRITTVTTNRKTNAFNKTDFEACGWVFLSALLGIEGSDAVINIKSYYKKHEVSSQTEYECHAGAVIAGVALEGDIVTLKK